MESVIRLAELRDVAAVQGIYGYYVETTAASFELEVPELAEMERRFWAVVDMGLPYLVAEAGGRVAGFATATMFRPRPAYRLTVENTVYVDREMRGKGLGGQLLEELIGRCGAAGYRQMVAAIGGRNPASVALHARAGFRAAGTLYRVGRKFDAWQDLLLMQRAIGGGDDGEQAEGG